MSRYTVTIDGVPRSVLNGDALLLDLLLDRDDGESRTVSVMLTGQCLRRDLDDIETSQAWRASARCAALELDAAFTKRGWGFDRECQYNLVVNAPGPKVRQLVQPGDPAEGLTEGSVVHEFEA